MIELPEAYTIARQITELPEAAGILPAEVRRVSE